MQQEGARRCKDSEMQRLTCGGLDSSVCIAAPADTSLPVLKSRITPPVPSRVGQHVAIGKAAAAVQPPGSKTRRGRRR